MKTLSFMKLIRPVRLLLAGVLSLCVSGCVDLLNATIPANGYKVVRDIAYGDGQRRKLDIYIPDVLAKGQPVVVFYYGGSWQMGSKDDYLFAGQAFASQGIVTVIADYRLFPEVYFPVFMSDVASAFVWTHRHIADYGGNPKNIFVVGHSAGAYNAMMLTLNRSYLRVAGGSDAWIRGVIGISGPYDFLPLTDEKLITLFSRVPAPETQPITFARPHTPPMLLLTGSADEDVLPRNSLNLAEKLRHYGDEVRYKIYPGLAHIGIVLSLAERFRSKAPVLYDCVDFINHHLYAHGSALTKSLTNLPEKSQVILDAPAEMEKQ